MKLTRILASAAVLIAAVSCSAPKNLVYFQDIHADDKVEVPSPFQVIVQPGDKIRVIVATQDERLTQMFNLSNSSMTTGSGEALGYTVTSEGTIDLPGLGIVKVAGLTREKIAANIKKEIQDRNLVKEPVVVVDFVNLGVTVLGDVNTPGVYPITKDRYTILEAIAQAGDLKITAKRENIKVVRNEVGIEQVYEIDLTKAEQVYSSPVFFLRQNDMIYVEPNDKALRESTVNGNSLQQYGFWMGLISFALSIGVIVLK